MGLRAVTARGRRAPLLAAGAVVMTTVSVVPAPARADAPANDAWESATPVTTFPFEDTLDTTEATTDPVNPPEMGRFPGTASGTGSSRPRTGASCSSPRAPTTTTA